MSESVVERIFLNLGYKHNNKLPGAYLSAEVLGQFSQSLQLVPEEGLQAILPYYFLEESHLKHYLINSPLQR